MAIVLCVCWDLLTVYMLNFSEGTKTYIYISCHSSTLTGHRKLKSHLTLRWCHNERDGVSNHQPHHCLLNRLFRRRSKKTSKLRVTGLCVGNSPVTGEFPAQRASNAENDSIWWRHLMTSILLLLYLHFPPFPDIETVQVTLVAGILPHWTQGLAVDLTKSVP